MKGAGSLEYDPFDSEETHPFDSEDIHLSDSEQTHPFDSEETHSIQPENAQAIRWAVTKYWSEGKDREERWRGAMDDLQNLGNSLKKSIVTPKGLPVDPMEGCESPLLCAVGSSQKNLVVL